MVFGRDGLEEDQIMNGTFFRFGAYFWSGFLCGYTKTFRTKLSLSTLVAIIVPVSQSRRDGYSVFSLSRTTSPTAAFLAGVVHFSLSVPIWKM